MLPDLYDDDVEPLDHDEVAELSELDGRRAMIRLRQLERDHQRTKATKTAVAAEYDAKLAAIEREQERIRATLRALVFRFGKLSFPDVGTAYKRKTDPKIEIVDMDAFKAELGAMFVKTEFDAASAKQFALDQALEDGVIVPGTELVPAGEDITVRKT